MEKNVDDKDNIFFSIDENVDDINDFTNLEFSDILNEIESIELKQEYNSHSNMFDITMPQILNYNMNFTVKELLLICDYYEFSKVLKANKCNKDVIIHFLVSFENNKQNEDIVLRRKNMWFYVNELKNDKYMKKYILW